MVDFTLLAADESVEESLMRLLCVYSVFPLMYVCLYISVFVCVCAPEDTGTGLWDQ